MKDKLTIQLCDSILEWWEENQYERFSDDYHCLCGDPPEFIILAKRLKSKEINDNK